MPPNPEPPPVYMDVIPYGLVTVINIICVLVQKYSTHRATAVSTFPPEIISALDVLVDGCDVLRQLNSPGPKN